MPKILRNLKIDDVSSVDVGAGRGVKVVLAKRDASTEAVGAVIDGMRRMMRKHRDGVPAALYNKPLSFGAELPKEALSYLKREFSDKERQARAENGHALPDGSFPIDDKKDLGNAIDAVGRAKDPAKAKAHIKARAKDLGAEDMLPDGWQVDKRATPQEVLAVVEKAVASAVEKSAVDFSEAYAMGETAEAVGGLMNELREAVYALDCSICSILGDEDVADKQSAITTSYKQFQQYIGGLGLGSDDDDETEKRDMTTPALSPAVEKIIADAVAKAVTSAVSAKDAELAKRDEQIAYLKMSDKHKAYHDGLGSDAEKKKFTSMTSDERDSEMEKTRKRAEDDPIYKSMQAENAALKKRLDALELDKDLAIAKSDAKAMGLTQVDAGEVLMKSRKGDRDAHKKLEEYMLGLAKRHTALETTSKAFEEFGTRNTGETGVSAHDELMAKAAEIRKANPALTEAQAYAKAYEDPANRELRNRESQERMSKIHGRAA